MDNLSDDSERIFTNAENDVPFKETESGIFDFDSFFSSINKSMSCNLSNDCDVELGYYLQAYEQLYNFFVLLGGAFQFVALDVKSKIKILQAFRHEEKEKFKSIKNFSTVMTMINHEKEMKCFANSKKVSGSRTLLRLHRGLDFIRIFLKEIYQMENNTKLGGVARQVYDNILAEHHTWIVKNTARIAMQFLPTRIELLNKISQNNEEELSHILEMFPKALEVMNIVYDRVQNIYTVNEILDLP